MAETVIVMEEKKNDARYAVTQNDISSGEEDGSSSSYDSSSETDSDFDEGYNRYDTTKPTNAMTVDNTENPENLEDYDDPTLVTINQTDTFYGDTTNDAVDYYNSSRGGGKKTRINKDDMFMEMSNIKRKKEKRKFTKYIMYTLNVMWRCLSLVDLVTDMVLLYRVTQASKKLEDENEIDLTYTYTVLLFLSIVAPYVLSYSSGIRLFLFRRTFDSVQGFYKLFLVLYIFPTGIFYWIFLDLLDLFFSFYRWILFVFFGWKPLEIKKLEETIGMCCIECFISISHCFLDWISISVGIHLLFCCFFFGEYTAGQLGMDVMNYEGYVCDVLMFANAFIKLIADQKHAKNQKILLQI